MTAYYNEIEPTAVLWLQAAMDAGHIAQGEIDTRPIQEVKADDLKGYAQCHWFAGVGGWSIALRMAGWDDSRPVWTGSCPCQPFSSAGKQKGKADDRHLWPIWHSLIRESKPTVIFGEQVSSAIAHGWLDDVYQGLEAEGYAVGSAVLPACSVGKAHKRERLFFVANTTREGLEARGREPSIECGQEQRPERLCKDGGNVANTSEPRLEGHGGYVREHGAEGRQEPHGCVGEGYVWIECPDGKARPIKPGLHLLVDGLPGRLRKAALHGYGNAIVPQVAADFIGAYMETL